jgi:hypothetical protein
MIGGVTRYIGTRWHYADTYRTILERGAAIERRHPVTYEGTAEGSPVLWDKATVALKRREMSSGCARFPRLALPSPCPANREPRPHRIASVAARWASPKPTFNARGWPGSDPALIHLHRPFPARLIGEADRLKGPTMRMRPAQRRGRCDLAYRVSRRVR